jgi:hypothetical protein
VQANATTEKGAILSFFIPTEMKIINAVKAKITLNRFRSYSQATAGGGESIISSSSGGSSVVSSSAGGSSVVSSSTGGSSTPTSAADGNSTQTSNAAGNASVTSLSATEVIYIGSVVGSSIINIPKTYISGETAYGGSSTTFSHKHSAGSLYFPFTQIGGVPSHTHQYSASGHSHTVNIPSHTHSVSIPSHTHSVSIPSHNHTVNVPNHTHTVSIPSHTHGITQGIFEFGSPTSADLYVNGVKKATIPASSSEIDITQYLLNAQGYVPRGSWINLEVRPNDLSYVIINLFVQGFIQSAGGGTY